MGGGLKVRPAREGDVDALLAVETAVFPADQSSRRAFRHAVRSETVLCLVAERDGAALGYVSVERRRGGTLARLTSIAVSPKAAGAGIGRALLIAAEQGARAEGCDRMRLEVRADNRPAHRLYERNGYARFAVVPDYYEDGAAAWRYEKRLA